MNPCGVKLEVWGWGCLCLGERGPTIQRSFRCSKPKGHKGKHSFIYTEGVNKGIEIHWNKRTKECKYEGG